MNRWYKSLLMFISLSLAYTSYAQKTIVGEVINTVGEMVIGANVLLLEGERLMMYTQTDSLGKFSMIIDQWSDSLSVEISHLRYEKYFIILEKAKNEYYAVLSQREVDLPEIVVQSETPAVVEKGDTLVFDVSAYTRPGDENIEQVLSRMPGIVIDENGQIFYGDLNISNFYIEGLDLMEGRYTILTRNLRAESIKKVEILRRHQPIRALDDIYKPPNAAINLKLKSKVLTTGSVKASLSNETEFEILNHLFGFTKKYQMATTAGFNNLGAFLTSDIPLFNSAQLLEQPLMEITQSSKPRGLKTTDYIYNKGYSITMNGLKKIGNDSQLKFELLHNGDERSESSSQENNYASNNILSQFAQQLHSNLSPTSWESRLIYELNKSRFYARSNNHFGYYEHKDATNNLINGIMADESIVNENLKFSSDNNFIIRKGNKAYQLFANFSLENKNYDALFSNVLLDNASLDTVNVGQFASKNNLQADIYTHFYYKQKYLEGKIRVGYLYMDNDISSSAEDANLQQSLGLLYLNDHITKKRSAYAHQSWKYERNQYEIELNFPLSLVNYSLLNARKNQTKRKFNEFLYEPSLNFYYSLDDISRIGLSMSYTKNIPSRNDLYYEGLIFRSSRNIQNQSFLPLPNFNQSYKLSYGMNSFIKNIVVNSSFTFSTIERRQLLGRSFSSNTLGSKALVQTNKSHLYTTDVYLKHDLAGRLSYSIDGTYISSRTPSIINNERIDFKSTVLLLQPKINYIGDIQSSTLSLAFENRKIAQSDFSNTFFRLGFSQFWMISENLSLNNSAGLVKFEANETSKMSSLFHLGAKYKVKKSKLTLEFKLLNLLDSRQYFNYFRGLYYEEITNYNIRPRRVIFELKKVF